MQNLVARYGKWALITGAGRSEGLGYSFAKALAQAGMNLVLIDILDDVKERAKELEQAYKIEARGLVFNLEPQDFLQNLAEITAGLEIALLICNHMYTPKETPTILDMDLAVHHRMMDINARAYTSLIHYYGRAMRERQKGAIIIVASGAGIVPTPYTGAYAANKAFQIALGEALWYELQPFHVDVTILAAGLMNTQGDALSKYPQFMMMEPETVVEEVLSNLGRKHMVVPGLVNKLVMFMNTKLLSRRQAVRNIGNFMAQGLGKN